MNKNCKKGFTIVELIIVIAVIAILAAVRTNCICPTCIVSKYPKHNTIGVFSCCPYEITCMFCNQILYTY